MLIVARVIKIKYMPTSFSKTVDKIEKGDNVTVVKDA